MKISNELKSKIKEIKLILANEINTPSEEFVKFFAKKVNSAPFTQSLREKFTIITKNALNQFINDRINDRLKFAMNEDLLSSNSKEYVHASSSNESKESSSPDVLNNNSYEIITTGEELEGYYIIKAILRGSLDFNSLSTNPQVCSYLQRM